MMLKCLRKSFSPDTQKVGLEAAILERKRNSSVDEGSGVENVSRLKASAEAAGATELHNLQQPTNNKQQFGC